jgi:ABC-2 type transport system ATP-binding protein
MIEAKHLTKYFAQAAAVDDVSFGVEKGEVLGFLGPNAAGKSTTMRMITGFLPPTSGKAVVGGHTVQEHPLRAQQKIGYLPENAPVYRDMTVWGFLDFIAEIRGLSGKKKRIRIEETLEKCFLSPVQYQVINTLSKGYKQRVCFAQSILHDPEYLIMDEPTDGLDPNQKYEVRTMIREMAREKAVILSTHILEEVEAVCTRVIIIANGSIVADETPDELKARSAIHGAVCCSFRGKVAESSEEELRGLEGVTTVEILEQGDDRMVVRIFHHEDTPPPLDQVIRFCGSKGYSLNYLKVEEGRLDEVFRMITARKNGAEDA